MIRKWFAQKLSNWLARNGFLVEVQLMPEDAPDFPLPYVGDLRWGVELSARGIRPIPPTKKDHTVCSVGWCEKDQKWYGWSHRAIYGFGIGSVVREGDCCASSGWTDEYLLDHPEADTSLPVGFEAKSLDDAKTMALAFAESVS